MSSRPTDEEMFEWGEKQRALVSSLSNIELARLLLDEVYGSVGMAEQEFCSSEEGHQRFEREYGAVREAAFRLAGIREYESKT